MKIDKYLKKSCVPINSVVGYGLALLLVSLDANSACAPTASISLIKPDTIYIDNADGTVTDGQTGLMWKKCSEGQTYSSSPTPTCTGTATSTFNWKQGMDQAGVVNADPAQNYGYNDWRVPSINELGTLLDRSCAAAPRINVTLFPLTPAGVFWTSTPFMGASTSTISNPANAWYVHFSTGVETTTLKDSTARYVRLVRDAD